MEGFGGALACRVSRSPAGRAAANALFVVAVAAATGLIVAMAGQAPSLAAVPPVPARDERPAGCDALPGRAIDLSEWDAASGKLVSLDGTWDFYWRQLLTPEDFASGKAPDPTGAFLVPEAWNQYVVDGKQVGSDGYATFRICLVLPAEAGDLALYVPYMSTAYRVWVGGELVAEAGVVGTSRETMRAQDRFTVARLNDEQRLGGATRPGDETARLEVVVQISNFMHRTGGWWRSILLGREEEVETLARRRFARDVALMAAYLITALHQGWLWLLRRSDRSPLAFGLICLAAGVGVGLTGDMPVMQVIDVNWEIELKLDYLIITALPVLVAWFIHLLYPEEVSGRLWRASGVAAGTFSVLVLVTPARVYSGWLGGYEVGAVVVLAATAAGALRAFAHRREGAGIFVAGMAVALVAGIHDMARWWAQVSSVELLPFAVAIWVFMQTFALSGRSAAAHQRVEALATQNRSLLATANTQLEEIRHSRRLLAAAEDSQRRTVAEFLHGRVQTRLLVVWHLLGESARLARSDPGKAGPALQQARALLDDIRRSDVQRASELLDPFAGESGLLDAVRALVARMEGTCPVRLEVDPAVERLDDQEAQGIPKAVRLATYRLVEEGLHNAGRHAGASSVVVSLRMRGAPEDEGDVPEAAGRCLEVQVEDDGAGFETESYRPGVGLTIVGEWVARAGGEWHVRSEPGHGTTIAARFQLPSGPTTHVGTEAPETSEHGG